MAEAPPPQRASSIPSITSLQAANAQSISAKPAPDWVLIAYGRVWVTGIADGVGVYEPTSGRLLETISIEGAMCGAPDAGFDSVWLPTCETRAIHRVAQSTNRLVATISVDLPAAGEFTIGAGEGAVWAIAENAFAKCQLVRISPDTNRIDDVMDIPKGAGSVRAGFGGVWVTYFHDDQVLWINPRDGSVISAIPTGRGPRFLAVGENGVWVMNQTSGSVTHIDPNGGQVVATIDVDNGPIKGGDITVGNGSVWVRGSRELVAEIDPVGDRVVTRIGRPTKGSASAAAGDGQLWISAGAEARLYRIPIRPWGGRD